MKMTGLKHPSIGVMSTHLVHQGRLWHQLRLASLHVWPQNKPNTQALQMAMHQTHMPSVLPAPERSRLREPQGEQILRVHYPTTLSMTMRTSSFIPNLMHSS